MAAKLFHNTRALIIQQIKSSLASGHKKLPTERELADKYLASYATVRLVMKSLEEDGFIMRIRGSGTYICPEADELLKKHNLQRVWCFQPPHHDNIMTEHSAWLASEMAIVAEKRGYNLLQRKVANHDAFLREIRQCVKISGNSGRLLKNSVSTNAKLSTELAKSQNSIKEFDAVIYIPTTDRFTVQQIGELTFFTKIPLILVDYDVGDLAITNISSDNRHGGMLAAEHLLSAGDKNLLILICEPLLRQSKERVRGFTSIASLSGVSVNYLEYAVDPQSDRTALAQYHLTAWLKTNPRPDGIFAISDAGAIGAMQALLSAGLKPGQDIDLIGFDGLKIVSQYNPPLTTIAQPVTEICNNTFDILDNWQPGLNPHRLIIPQLQPGGTVGKTAKSALKESVL